jgi:hypothetical protein
MSAGGDATHEHVRNWKVQPGEAVLGDNCTCSNVVASAWATVERVLADVRVALVVTSGLCDRLLDDGGEDLVEG